MAYRSPARWLAPLAIVGALVAILLTISSVNSGSSSSDSGSSLPATLTSTRTTSTGAGAATTTTTTTSSHPPRYYTVRPGDVLSAIAAVTNVPLSRIEQLNPTVDAQSLHVGQRIKLAP
jgi:LysM repeat protein